MDKKFFVPKGSIQDKSALQSKKFLAYLLQQFCTWGTLIYFLANWAGAFTLYPFAFCLALVLVSSFSAVAYIFNQASLDKFLMLAKEITPWGDDAGVDHEPEIRSNPPEVASPGSKSPNTGAGDPVAGDPVAGAGEPAPATTGE